MSDNLTDTDHLIRFIGLIISILSNIWKFIYVCYVVLWVKNDSKKAIKIPITKGGDIHHQKNAPKKWNYTIVMLILLLFLQFMVPLYNLVYRFIVPVTLTACIINDAIEEALVSINRLILLLFYCVRLTQIFKDTAHQISKPILIFFYTFTVIISTVFPALFIATQTVSARRVINFGTYCSNTGDPKIVIPYFTLDFILTVILLSIFVLKLRAVYRHETSVLDGFKRKKNKNKEKKEVRTIYKLKRVVRKNFILTMISIISSWLFIYHSIIPDEYTFYPDGFEHNILRWCYPFDYFINGWCIFLMFSWKPKIFKICDCDCLLQQRYIDAGVTDITRLRKDTVRSQGCTSDAKNLELPHKNGNESSYNTRMSIELGNLGSASTIEIDTTPKSQDITDDEMP